MKDIKLYKELNGDRQIKLSQHARERIKMYGRNPQEVRDLLKESIQSPYEFDPKNKRFKTKADHWQNGTLQFVTVNRRDDFTGRDIALVLTIFDQKYA